MIGDRFVQKGYNKEFAKEKIAEVAHMKKGDQIKDKTIPNCEQDHVPFVLDYNIQHKKIVKVIQHHWHILQSDKYLQGILPKRPRFIYRRAPSISEKCCRSPKKELHLFYWQKFLSMQKMFYMYPNQTSQ